MDNQACPFCSYCTSDSSILLRHYIKQHRNEDGFVIKCSQCYHPFTSVVGLVSHIRRGKHSPGKDVCVSVGVDKSSSSMDMTESSTDFQLSFGQSDKGCGDQIEKSLSDEETSVIEEEAFHHCILTSEDSLPTVTPDALTFNVSDDELSSDEDDLKDFQDFDDGIFTSDDSSGLSWDAAKFLLHLREEALVSQSAVVKTVHGVRDLLCQFNETVKSKILAGADVSGNISTAHVKRVFQEAQNSGIFNDLGSSKALDAFIAANCDVFEPVEVELKTTSVADANGRLKEETHFAYVSPFLKSLKRLLSQPDVLKYILNDCQSTDGKIRGYKDGLYSKNHKILSQDNTVGIVACFDELEVSSPLGPQKHKLAMYYWTLANLPPHIRASLRSICLLGIAWSRDLKHDLSLTKCKSFDRKYDAHCKILKNFLSGVRQLEKGVQIPVDDQEPVTIGGTVLCVSGDSPGVSTMCGSKESVGQAHKPCHKCHADHYEMKCIFDEDTFEKRTAESHMEQLETVVDISQPLYVREYYSTLYGINGPSVISGLTDFNPISCFVFDIMHVCHEGVLEAHMRALLNYAVNEKGYFKLADINRNVKALASQFLSRDRPAPMKNDHLITGLRQSASQFFYLGMILPLVLMKEPLLKDRLLNFILLMRIIHGLLAYETTQEKINELKKMIRKHHENFMVDYPDVEITPKFHFLTHLPSQILMFGVGRVTWTMRFEAMHSYFKNLIRITKNFKNPPLSMSTRYECLRACQMLSQPGKKPTGFIETDDALFGTTTVKLEEYQRCNKLKMFFEDPDSSVLSCRRIRSRGVSLARGAVVCVDDDSFASIEDIVIYDNCKMLIVKPLPVINYEPLCNGFKVNADSSAMNVVLLENLKFSLPLPLVKVDKSCVYVLPKYFFTACNDV